MTKLAAAAEGGGEVGSAMPPPSPSGAKSRKEVRAEKKAAKKAAAEASARLEGADPQEVSRLADTKDEQSRLTKKRRREEREEREREYQRDKKRERKVRKQKQVRREMNAPGGAKARAQKLLDRKRSGSGGGDGGPVEKKKEKKKDVGEDNREVDDRDVFDRVFNGTVDDTTGASTLQMGVKCIDIVTGSADSLTAEEGSLVTVRYRLSGKDGGAVIDSSKSFNFRIGKGEVIRGWDIGVLGMRVGGRRKLIVPPKAGYGGQDIGAGPGALLYFDITLLSCRAR